MPTNQEVYKSLHWWERLVIWTMLHSGWEINHDDEIEDAANRGVLGEWNTDD